MAQRLRIKFCRGEEIKFISHLDMVRLWERAIRRARVPLSYSQGFSPHPQLSFAVPLTVGMTSEAELLDIFCTRSVSPDWVRDILSQELPAGIKILEIYQVNPSEPSLQSLASFAEYVTEVETERSLEEVEMAVKNLLSLKTLPWQHQRDTGIKSYDLRPLINDIHLISCYKGTCTLKMQLRCDALGSGRPEQVTAALGFAERPTSIHRVGLKLMPANVSVS